MIRYYESATQVLDGQTQPIAKVIVASRSWIAYNNDKTLAGFMVEVTDEQHNIIISSGGIEKTREEIAVIYPFPAIFSLPPIFGA